MTPIELAQALRDVEIANEEENYAKFQSDAAIVEEAAGMLEKQAEEIKELKACLKSALEEIEYLEREASE